MLVEKKEEEEPEALDTMEVVPLVSVAVLSCRPSLSGCGCGEEFRGASSLHFKALQLAVFVVLIVVAVAGGAVLDASRIASNRQIFSKAPTKRKSVRSNSGHKEESGEREVVSARELVLSATFVMPWRGISFPAMESFSCWETASIFPFFICSYPSLVTIRYLSSSLPPSARVVVSHCKSETAAFKDGGGRSND